MMNNKTWWDRWSVWIAPALMTAVALIQARTIGENNLSRWKGGGFGMFSTIDSPGNRFVVFALLKRDKAVGDMLYTQGTFPEDNRQISAAQGAAVALPTKRNLEDLGRSLLQLDWYAPPYNGSKIPAPGRSVSKPEAKQLKLSKLEIDGIRLELRRMRWDFQKGTVSSERLSATEVMRGE